MHHALVLNLKNSEYLKHFSNKLINKCIINQKKLVNKAYNLLKKGGILVYSTCSLLKEENEDIIDYAAKNGFENFDIDVTKYFKNIDLSMCNNIIRNSKFIKILPNTIYEGFFVSKLMKK